MSEQKPRVRKNTARSSTAGIPDVPARLQRGASNDEELRQTICTEFRNSEIFRAAAVRALLNDLRSLEQDREAESNYSLPAFSEHQADCNGSIRVLRRVLKDVFGVDTYGRASEARDEAEETESS